MEYSSPEERNTAIVAAIGRGVPLETVCAIFAIDVLTVRRAVESAGQTMPVELPGPDVVIATREAEMLRRALNGEDFSVISRSFAVSREWVRLVVKRYTGLSAKDLKAARDAARQQFKVQQLQDHALSDEQLHLDELAQRSNLSVREVEELLGPAESARRRRSRTVTHATERDQALAAIGRVASLPGGSPLSRTFYDSHRDEGLSSSRLMQMFGSWLAACEEAGVEGIKPFRDEYRRNWTRDDCLRWVHAYVTTVERPTFNGYDAWSRQQAGAPSGGTVRLRCGTWISTVRDAHSLGAEGGVHSDSVAEHSADDRPTTSSASTGVNAEPSEKHDDDADPGELQAQGGQGFQHDVELRLATEIAAQERLMEHFRRRGWFVEDTHIGHPYDAVASKGDEVRFLEAKGTQTTGDTVMVTQGEVAHALAHPGQCFMGIRSGIEFDERGVVRPGSGLFRIVRFKPDEGSLTPISYEWCPRVV